MNYELILSEKEFYRKHSHLLSQASKEKYNKSFTIQYTHDPTAIEGNTLSLMETKLLLEDQLSVGGKQLREIYEVVNHNKAYQYVEKCIAEDKPLNENIIKDIHQLLMENILQGGIYRMVSVIITGAQHKTPAPSEMYQQIKNFYEDLSYKKTEMNPIEYAAWTHGEFVRIHPFEDGNDKTSRLLMNYQLLSQGFLPVSIKKENRLAYFDALEVFALTQNVQPFADMIAELELEHLKFYNDSIKMIMECDKCKY